jgi:hypothetical protein
MVKSFVAIKSVLKIKELVFQFNRLGHFTELLLSGHVLILKGTSIFEKLQVLFSPKPFAADSIFFIAQIA